VSRRDGRLRMSVLILNLSQWRGSDDRRSGPRLGPRSGGMPVGEHVAVKSDEDVTFVGVVFRGPDLGSLSRLPIRSQHPRLTSASRRCSSKQWCSTAGRGLLPLPVPIPSASALADAVSTSASTRRPRCHGRRPSRVHRQVHVTGVGGATRSGLQRARGALLTRSDRPIGCPVFRAERCAWGSGAAGRIAGSRPPIVRP